MKYCQKCGNEIMDDAVICIHCGCQVANLVNPVQKTAPAKPGNDGLAVASKVLLFLGNIFNGIILILFGDLLFVDLFSWYFIPFFVLFIASLVITITICYKMNRGEHVGIGIKICALLFVSLVGGILLLCRSDDILLAENQSNVQF